MAIVPLAPETAIEAEAIMSIHSANGLPGHAKIRNVLGYAVFRATDTTGSTDMTSELEAFLEMSPGPVFIPAGDYLINNANVAGDVQLYAKPGTVTFLNDYQQRTFLQRNDNDAEDSHAVTAVDLVGAYENDDSVTRLTLAPLDAITYTQYEWVHFHSQDGWEVGEDNRIGEGAKVARVDLVKGYVYLDRRLEYHDYYLTLPRLRKMSKRKFKMENIMFAANGDHDDPELNDGRQACIEIMGATNIEMKDCVFEKIWSTAVLQRSCVGSTYTNARFINMLNLGAPDGAATDFAISGITQANPAVASTTATHGYSNGELVYLRDVIGMTEVNDKYITVANVTATTFELTDADSGDVIDSTAFAAYTSGGLVTFVDIEALGYGVNFYGASADCVMTGCRAEEGRHAVMTTGSVSDPTYSEASTWAYYGMPTNIYIGNCWSFNAHGFPFDTHSAGRNIVFDNCWSFNTSRGPDYSSYLGGGFHIRCMDTIIKNCGVIGGTYAYRYHAVDHPIRPVHHLENSIAKQLYSPVNREIGVLIDSSTTIATLPRVNINNFTAHDMTEGIQVGENSICHASGLVFEGVDNLIDVHAGAELVVYDRVRANFRDSRFSAGSNKCINMRSKLLSEPTALLLGGISLSKGTSSNQPTRVFDAADSTADKWYYCKDLVQLNISGVVDCTIADAAHTELKLSTLVKVIT